MRHCILTLSFSVFSIPLAGCSATECGAGTHLADETCVANRPTRPDDSAGSTDSDIDSAPDTDSGTDSGADSGGDTAPPVTCENEYLGDLDLSSHDAMVAFCAEYDCMLGTLSITGDGVTDTDPLSCLKSIKGGLQASGSALRDITLPALTEMTGGLDVEGVPALTAVSLPNVPSIGGAVTIDAPAMTALSLPLVTTVGGNLNVQDTALSVLELPVLTEIGGYAYVQANRGESTVSFPVLTRVGGDLLIEGSTKQLSTPLLGTVDGDLTFRGNLPATSVSLPSLVSLTGSLDLSSRVTEVYLPLLHDAGMVGVNGVVVTLDLPSLVEVGTLYAYNRSIQSLSAPNLVTVGELELLSADSLQEVSFPRLSSLGGLRVDGCALVTALDLPAVTGPLSSLTLTDTALETLDLHAVTGITGDVQVDQNSVLRSIDLSDATAVGGTVQIESNAALEALELPSAVSLGSALSVLYNPALLRIEVPNGSGDTWVDIEENGALESVRLGIDTAPGGIKILADVTTLELPALTYVGGDFYIEISGSDSVDLGALETVDDKCWFWASGATTLSMPALVTTGALTLSAPATGTLALASLTAPGVMTLYDFDALETVDLPVLTTVRGLTIEYGIGSSLDGFAGLDEVIGTVNISSNDDLTDVLGLSGLTRIVGALSITDNSSLSTANAMALVDAIGSSNIGGRISIERNAR